MADDIKKEEDKSSTAGDVASWLLDASPWILGSGGLAALGGALITGKREGETPQERMSRRLKNALIAGAMGAGVGAGGKLVFDAWGKDAPPIKDDAAQQLGHFLGGTIDTAKALKPDNHMLAALPVAGAGTAAGAFRGRAEDARLIERIRNTPGLEGYDVAKFADEYKAWKSTATPGSDTSYKSFVAANYPSERAADIEKYHSHWGRNAGKYKGAAKGTAGGFVLGAALSWLVDLLSSPGK